MKRLALIRWYKQACYWAVYNGMDAMAVYCQQQANELIWSAPRDSKLHQATKLIPDAGLNPHNYSLMLDKAISSMGI